MFQQLNHTHSAYTLLGRLPASLEWTHVPVLLCRPATSTLSVLGHRRSRPACLSDLCNNDQPTTVHKRHIYIEKQLNPFAGTEVLQNSATPFLSLLSSINHTLYVSYGQLVFTIRASRSVLNSGAHDDALYKMEQFLAINSYSRRRERR